MNIKNVSLSLFIATTLFVTSVSAIGALLLSYEVKQFHSYVENLSKIKQQVILLGLLTESQLEQYEDTSIEELESLTNFSFQDAVYALDSNEEFTYVEAVARRVFHQTEDYLANIYKNPSSILYFRSYTGGNKLILERPLESLENNPSAFDLEVCKKEVSCVLAAWKGQLTDRVLFSKPFKSMASGEHAVAIMSPIYYKEQLVGEFSTRLYLTDLYKEGKAVDAVVSNGNKQIIIYFPGYPLPNLAYSQSYMADNNNLIVYRYPFSKILVDYSFLFVLYFIASLAYLTKAYESNQSKMQLASALTDSTKDELTGLYNRRLFKDDKFKARLDNAPYTVMAIDGNRIKRINDKYGHHVGDDAIAIIAESMQKVFRNSDYLVRTGGDEFLAILPSCSLSQASVLASKLQGVVKDNRLKTLDIEISVCIGLATSEEHESLEDVIIRADEELYEMKKQRD
ncbi:GGDEF domain-containing protein [Vibrio sp. B1FLJ16]|uniref:GGDEF domain-containing protein n=1 Tax=Vibrio sp. B1FLJ16 TaxID=2751178 RepID=UPI0015F4C0EC|nr:GGDEF domain-containing protein [Vibrio sp. B1FLJ16]